MHLLKEHVSFEKARTIERKHGRVVMKTLTYDVLIIPLFPTKRRLLTVLYSKANTTQMIALWVDSTWQGVREYMHAFIYSSSMGWAG